MFRTKKINQGKSAAKKLRDHCQEESSGKKPGKIKTTEFACILWTQKTSVLG
jgi:hypothetical protein